jgi:MFS family permease
MGQPPLLTAAFAWLTLAHFLQALGWSTMLLLPLYLAHLGASRAEIGAVMGFSAMGGLALRPVVAVALDRFGRRPTLVVGTFLVAGSMGLIALVDDVGWLIRVQRVLFGIGTGALFTGYFTAAADIIPTARRTEGIALFGISGLAPLAINPLAQLAGVDAPSLRIFLPAAGALVLLSLVPLTRLRLPPLGAPPEPLTIAAFVRAISRPALAPVWLATWAFAAMVALLMAFLTVSAASRGVGRPALVWLTYAAGAIGVRAFGARLPDRLGPANLVAPSVACTTAALLLAAQAEGTRGFLLAGLLGGLGHGTCFPVLTSQVVSRAPIHLRGSAMATFTALWEVASLSAPPLGGWLADQRSDAAMFAAAAVVAVVMLGVWLGLEARFGEPVPRG